MADFVDQVLKEIAKEYGDGIARDGDDIVNKEDEIISFSPAFDIALGGGIVKPGFVTIAGKAKVGKTTSVLSFAKKCQDHGMTVAYMSVEHRLKKKNLLGIRGLNWHKPHFIIFESEESNEAEGTKANILTAQHFLNLGLKLLTSIPNLLLIFDSFSMLLDAKEMDGGVEKETRGGGAKLLARFCRDAAPLIAVNKSIVVGILHLMANTSGMGASIVEKGGNAVQYALDVKLRARGEVPWLDSKGSVIGQTVKWEIAESALGPPGRVIDSWIRYGVGIDDNYELFMMGQDLGLIEVKGSWYFHNFLRAHPNLFGVEKWDDTREKQIRVQGAEKSFQMLVDHPEWAAILQKEVTRMVGSKQAS